jgi:hypothetical protein
MWRATNNVEKKARAAGPFATAVGISPTAPATFATSLGNIPSAVADFPQGGGIVELQFTKSTAEGIKIFSKRGEETDFTFLATDLHPPYVDTRPMLVAGKSELREYRAKFMVDDQVVGLFSNEVVVSCKP